MSAMLDAISKIDEAIDRRERERDERQKARIIRENDLRNIARDEMLLAIELLALAARAPDIARRDMQQAEKHFERAYDAVLELDPTPEEENA